MLNMKNTKALILPFLRYFKRVGINTDENVLILKNELLVLGLSLKNMRKIVVLIGVIFLALPGQAQNYIGVRSDIMSYSLKSQYGHVYNSGTSYSVFSEFHYKPLISFGGEVGGYKFQFDNNKSTNIYVKPTVIFNGQIRRSTLSVFAGASFDVSLNSKINNANNYYTGENIIGGITEKAYFYHSFGALCGGFSYSYRIKNIDLGLRFETLTSQGGFYKGYDSNFQRFGIFVKYRISKK